MKAFIFCQKCLRIRGCVEIKNGKEIVKICYNCRFKPIRDCEKDTPTHELKQLCIDCLVDLALTDNN